MITMKENRTLWLFNTKIVYYNAYKIIDFFYDTAEIIQLRSGLRYYRFILLLMIKQIA